MCFVNLYGLHVSYCSFFTFCSKVLSNTVNVRLDGRDWSLAIGVKERKKEGSIPEGGRGTASNFG